MKSLQVFLFCLCLSGATQLGKSQVKQPTAPPIPGYLDPATGKFTTQIAPAAPEQGAQPNTAVVTGTSLFFREDFGITIQNYDQNPNSTVFCFANISTTESGGYTYSDGSGVAATAVSGGWSCDVPVLTLWTLKTPASDTISVSLTVQIIPPGVTYQNTTNGPGRVSYQYFTLAVPGNTQTVYNNATFQL